MATENYQPSEPSLFLEGVVEKIVFHKPESGFTVVKITPRLSSSTTAEITVIGETPLTLVAGMNIQARGRYETHSRFGRQFRAYSILELLPTTKEGLLRYFSSGIIRGFGEVLAERAVSYFGATLVEILDTQPKRLLEIPGIGAGKLKEITSSWVEAKEERECYLFFSEIGINGALSQKIFKRFGKRSIEVVRGNPYSLIDELIGVGFLTADKLALSLGIDPLSDQRLSALLIYQLKQASEDGHTYLPLDILIERAMRELAEDTLKDRLKGLLNRISVEGKIVIITTSKEPSVYLPDLYRFESQLAQMLFEISNRPCTNLNSELLNSAIKQRYLASGSENKLIVLSAEQQQAMHKASCSSLTVVTGGPGCGKTTLVRSLVSLFRSSGMAIRLTAPTGRAAQRLSELCEHEASTIHRLLKFDPITRSFSHGSEEPLECDVIIVDESSMIDIALAQALLLAVPRAARIVFIGDANQLPSVGPGLFFRDLLELFPHSTVCLTQLFRRAQESLISIAAHQVNCGEIPEIPEPDGITRTDAYFLPIVEAVEGAVLVERLVADQIPKKFGFCSNQITVLTPMNQGELGAQRLNTRLQDKLLPSSLNRPSLKVNGLEFRLGDRVCQRVNNYNITGGGVFNGDQGRVIGVDEHNVKLVVKLWDGREIEYHKDSLGQLDLSYAISIHRSQGSEIPAVVLVLHDSQAILLERQLIYTAITRAKKLLIIVGSKRALIMAVRKTKSQRRFSGLISQFRTVVNSQFAA